MSLNNSLLYKILSWLMVAVSGPFLAACSDDTQETEMKPVPQIVFLFSPGGLGDLSYNDCILSGVQQFKNEHPEVDVFMYSPPSVETAERIFSDWMKRPGSNIPVLFVLASSDFEEMVDKYHSEYPLTSNKRILLFESLRDFDDERIYTFQVSMYGASYLAGKTAALCAGEKGSLVLLGSSADIPVYSARDGFAAGYGEKFDLEFLADDWTGYVMAPEAYGKMRKWAADYGFIFPVAGGSNIGLYRYSREYGDCPYLAGMDVDQSDYSDKITGSVVKRFDRLMVEYLSDWLAGGTMPDTHLYGLDSQYVDWVLSPLYKDKFSKTVEDNREEAVAREREYYEIDY